MTYPVEVFPPRGSGIPGRTERLPSAIWATPDRFGDAWAWRPGRVLLGRWRGQPVGFDDDRHILTVAGTRAGKTSTVLLHNLAVIGLNGGDGPQGSWRARPQLCARQWDNRCLSSIRFVNCARSWSPARPTIRLPNGFGRADLVAPDAAIAADALIISNEKDPHWTDSARNLIRALVLFLIVTESRATIRRLRAVAGHDSGRGLRAHGSARCVRGRSRMPEHRSLPSSETVHASSRPSSRRHKKRPHPSTTYDMQVMRATSP